MSKKISQLPAYPSFEEDDLFIVARPETDQTFKVTVAEMDERYSGGAGGGATVWRNGPGEPDDSLGANGDYYLDDETGDVYKKVAGAYEVTANIEGPQGIQGSPGNNGENGKTILYGTDAPTTEGVDGDFYIRTSTNFIYGPKDSGVWPAGTSIVGPIGPTGPAGSYTAGSCIDLDDNIISLDLSEASATQTISLDDTLPFTDVSISNVNSKSTFSDFLNQQMIQQSKDYTYFMEDFLYEFGTGTNGTVMRGVVSGGTNTCIPYDISYGNALGILSCGSGVSGYGVTRLNVASWNLATGTYYFETRFRIGTLSAVANRYVALTGFFDTGITYNVVNGIYFCYAEGGNPTNSAASPNFQVATVSTSSRFYTTTSVPVNIDTWYKLSFVATTSQVRFYIDDVLVASHSERIPTVSLLNALGTFWVAGANRNVIHDYHKVICKFNTQR